MSREAQPLFAGAGTTVAWWKRLLLAFGALLFTLLLPIASVTVRDFWREPELQWFNGGETQIVVFILLVGGLLILATYIVFVAPLVLLWLVESQHKHWFMMLCVSMLWPPILAGIIWHYDPWRLVHEMYQNPGIFGWPEVFALISCSSHLLLLRWRRGRG